MPPELSSLRAVITSMTTPLESNLLFKYLALTAVHRVPLKSQYNGTDLQSSSMAGSMHEVLKSFKAAFLLLDDIIS